MGSNYIKENSQHNLAPATDEEDEGKPPSVIEDPVSLESYSMLAHSSWEENIIDCPVHACPMKFAIGKSNYCTCCGLYC